MRVEQLMTRDVRCCRPEESLAIAARIMWDFDCGCVPVVDDGGRVIGMITDRDICMATTLQDARPAEIPVDRPMSRDVHSCRETDSVQAAEKLMEVYQIRRLPVLGADGRIVGILSLNDIAREAERERLQSSGRHEVSAEGVTEAFAAVCAPRTNQASAVV